MAGRTRSTPTNGATAAARKRRPDAAEVARMAYELFERRGRLHGFDQQDWLQAEQMLRQPRSRRSA